MSLRSVESLRLSKEGYEIAKNQAIARFGTRYKSALADAVKVNKKRISRDTIIRFFKEENIQFDCFDAICTCLGLNWQEVGDSRSYWYAASPGNSNETIIDVNSESSVLEVLTIRRTPRTGQGYIEPLLDVGVALPLHMVLIPGGTFMMGSPDDEPERNGDHEAPQHDVTVSQFFMGRYPVTQAQWQAVAHLPEVKQALDPEPSYFKGKDNHPVEQVSWNDAIEFCARLEKHTKRPYRLPSEAEWEYACRARTTTPFYFGKTLTDELANYDASVTYADGPQGRYRKGTTAVDYFGIANAFGLGDMHGNVFEWCQDHWYGNYKSAPTDGSAWLTDNENTRRIYRGGSWGFDPRYCRSAYRYYRNPDARSYRFGFRVCCSAPKTS
jgi:formylglycine-generating enzyme required for sulfatase activity